MKFMPSILFSLAIFFITFATTPTLHAQEFDPFSLPTPGTALGTATTTFAVHDSGYLDVVLTTDEPVTGRVSSISGMVQMDLAGSGTTTITISGLLPSTEYHRYEDSYENHTPFTSDENGSYSFSVDLTDRHSLWIQEQPSTC